MTYDHRRDKCNVNVKNTCLRKPAPKARVTFKEPFTLSFLIAEVSLGCSLLILRTSCNNLPYKHEY